MVSGSIRLAHGSISFVRTRHIPMVSSLAVAISDLGLDAADRFLDCQHYPYLRYVAFARTWSSMGLAPCLDHAGGIWVPDNRRCNDCPAPNHAAGGARYWTGLVRRADFTETQLCTSVSRNPVCVPLKKARAAHARMMSGKAEFRVVLDCHGPRKAGWLTIQHLPRHIESEKQILTTACFTAPANRVERERVRGGLSPRRRRVCTKTSEPPPLNHG